MDMVCVRRRTTMLPSAIQIFALLMATAWSPLISAYPMIAHVEDEDETCFRYNIPHEDDAHMIFVAAPDSIPDEVEEWFVSTIDEMVKKGGQVAPTFPAVPANVRDLEGKVAERNTDVFLKVSIPGRVTLRSEQFKFYKPIVLDNVVEQSKRSRAARGEVPLGGYSICFENEREEHIRVIMDVVLVSSKGEGGGTGGHNKNKKEKRKLIKKDDLSPLESNFQDSIDSAHEILSEMSYMDKREARMRHTADSTNSRIRLFSYVSVVILLGVTWMQVTYLKSYFRKKKLL